NIDAEVVDLRCLMPLDIASIITSVKKTGRLVVAEPGWRMYGAAAEIVATVAETLGEIRSRPRRVAWPQSAVPTSSRLDEQFYPTSDAIVAACRDSVAESRVRNTARCVHIPRNRRCVFLFHTCPSSSLTRNPSSRACGR